MLIDDLKSLFGTPNAKLTKTLTTWKKETAPTTFDRRMSPYYIWKSETASLDVDFVQMCINTSLQGDMTPLLALYRDIESSDNVIQSAIATRKLAALASGVNMVAAPNSGDDGKVIAAQAQAMLDRSDTFIDACTWLLHGCIWPVSIVERKWMPGGNGFSHPEFRAVPLELLDYRTRELRLYDTDERGARLATSHVADSNRYITHRGHLLMAPDHWGGPMRCLVFWFLFKTQNREWWARFLERFGSPFMMGYYDKNDDESRLNLERAFQDATRLFGIVATRETQVEIKETKMDPGTAFQMFYECAKNEILLAILGQTLSGSAQSTGLGSGVADLQSGVREDYRKWDAFRLGACIRKCVIKPWMELNDIQGPAPWPAFGGFSPSALASLAPFLDGLQKGGLELDDDSIQIVSKYAGVTIRRTSKPTPPMGLPVPPSPETAAALAAAGLTPSAAANESIAGAGAADISRAWSGELAPLGEIVASSRTTRELLTRATAFLRSYRAHESAALIAQSLDAFVANAAVGG